MRFQPKSEKEIAEMNLWPAGEYGFEIVQSLNNISKSGNEMIELKVKVYNDDGGYKLITDFLLESLAYKLRHAAEVCGLLSQYEAGELDANDFIGKTGTVKLKIQKDKNGQYPDKNVIADYIADYVVEKAEGKIDPQAPVKSAAAELDDEIPWA